MPAEKWKSRNQGLITGTTVYRYHLITGVTGNRYESSPIPVQCPPRGLSRLLARWGSLVHFRVIIKIARKRIHAVINQYRVERDYAFLPPRCVRQPGWTGRYLNVEYRRI